MANGRRGHAKKIDAVHWTSMQGFAGSLSSGTVGVLIANAQHLPETLLRIRGEWASAFSGAAVDAIGDLVTAGLILVPEGTGTSVLWSPQTDADAPWIWWDTFTLIYQEMVTDAVWSSNTSDARRVVDSKAMRKVRNRELQLVIENTTLLSAAAVDVSLNGRVLSGS